MERGKLGDSYDAVKRLWREVLEEWAPLYANPRFVPGDLEAEYTRITRIPLLREEPSGPYSILNDPDTGVRLPDSANQRGSRRHIALHSIAEQLRSTKARAVITFDQSNYRLNGDSFEAQRQTKMRYLANEGFFPLYYASHAPFLFTCRSARMRRELRELLIGVGIPAGMFELPELVGNSIQRHHLNGL